MDLLSSSSSKTFFEQFLIERRYLKNVTPDTIEWYETAFKAFQRALGTPSPEISQASLQQFVVSTRERGVKAISCNDRTCPMQQSRGDSAPWAELDWPPAESSLRLPGVK